MEIKYSDLERLRGEQLTVITEYSAGLNWVKGVLGGRKRAYVLRYVFGDKNRTYKIQRSDGIWRDNEFLGWIV